MLNSGILGLGSNYDRESRMLQAREMLMDVFADISFGEAVYTEPIHYNNPELFLNQVAVIKTGRKKEEVLFLLKKIETALGRNAEDKISEKIPIDIDLIQWNEEVLKPQDLSRSYILQGLRLLQ